MRGVLWIAALAALSACGGTRASPSGPGATSAAKGPPAGREKPRLAPPVREARTLSAPAHKSFAVRRLSAAGPAVDERPLGTRRRVDVSFRGASLANALSFLANAGRFSLVADGPLTGTVDADLRNVVPYEALVALARAHGAQVQRRGRVVIVRPHDD